MAHDNKYPEPKRVEVPGDGIGMVDVTIHDYLEIGDHEIYALQWDDDSQGDVFMIRKNPATGIWYFTNGEVANVEFRVGAPQSR